MAQVSFGQSLFSTLKQRLSFGIKVGANYSDFSNANFDTEGLTGFHAGAIINFKLSGKWSIQEEFLYSQQGAKIKNATFINSEDLKLSYLTVPVVIKYHTNIGIYAEFGGQASMLTENAKNTSFKDFADKIDAGAVAGLGYQFKFGPGKGLGLGARYYYGLLDVGKFDSSMIKSDFKNSLAQLSVFYFF